MLKLRGGNRLREPMDSISPKNNWPNYTTFVNALAPVDLNLKWLAHFFSLDRVGPTSEGSLHVLEFDEDGIADQAGSLDKLHSPPTLGNTRVVLLSYSDVWTLNLELLDRIALSLNLPPYFLSQHLYRTRSSQEYPLHFEYDNFMAQNFSEFPSLEIGFMMKLHLSAMVISPASASAGATLIVLLQNKNWSLDLFRYTITVSGPADTSQSDIDGLYRDGDGVGDVVRGLLDNMSIDDIRAATRNHATDFLCPLINGFCNYMTLLIEASDVILAHDAASYEAAPLNEFAMTIENDVLPCRRTINSIYKYLNAHPEARTPAMSAALENLRLVHGMFKDQLDRCQMLTSRLVSIMSLKESRRSVEQSVSTRRLTQLAYLFLPLGLSTSAFGMNVAPLQNVQIWVFFVTSFALLLASLSIWCWFDWLSDQAYWLLDWAYHLFYVTKVLYRTYNARRRARSDQDTIQHSPLP